MADNETPRAAVSPFPPSQDPASSPAAAVPSSHPDSIHTAAAAVAAAPAQEHTEGDEHFFEAAAADAAALEAEFGVEDLPGQLEGLRVLEPEERSATKARSMKEKGNACYAAENYEGALECYGLAIKLCPFQYDKEREMARARRKMQRQREAEEREEMKGGREGAERAAGTVVEEVESTTTVEGGGKENQSPSFSGDAAAAEAAETEKEEEEEEEEAPEPFVEHKEECAVYYGNRAACWVHMGRDQEAVDDCRVALKLKPGYLKALMRRAQACERLDKLEDALSDYKAVLAIDPTNRVARGKVPGLEKECAVRLEKLKEETMGKLKDLGNSVLSNFGLSLDNFKMQQDPNTGSYSFSFQK
eukprot:evm.model.NODE_16461_length_16004_cov_18.749063.1